ncbi:MAG: hypothetical protein NVS1B4_08580 [Gemmatimonadaceae bacterium]
MTYCPVSLVVRVAACAVVASIAAAAPAPAQDVLMSPAQAVKEIFPEAARVDTVHRRLDGPVRKRLERELGRRIDDEDLDVLRIYDAAGGHRGYAVVTEEIGKYRPITFMVGVTTELRVRDVAVLVYRESRGGEVRRRRFLDQYRGKRGSDPFDVSRDIINVSGATISVRSLNAGVKRVLAELTALFPMPPGGGAGKS